MTEENKPLNNNIENQLQQINPMTETTIADVLREKEILRSEVIKEFIANAGQKTEITPSERKVIPLLMQLALNPFPDIAQHIEDEDKKKEIEEEFVVDYLSGWVDQYITLGIPVGRKGRKEEVEVLKSYLDEDIDIKNSGGSFQ